MKGISIAILTLSQVILAIDLRARSDSKPNEVKTKKTRDNGKTKKFNGVWWPLPEGFDQSRPDSILGTVASQSSKLPFGNTLKYERVVVFGDSSSDTKNQFAVSKKSAPNPKKYWNGRVSNGPMWPDYLEKHYGLNMDNKAYGGATVNNAVYKQGENAPDFFQQVESYLKNPSPRPAETLVIVNFVGNDLIKKQGPQKLTADITTNIQKLVDNGIKNFVVFQGTNRHYLEDLKMEPAMVDMVKKFQGSHKDAHIELFPAWDLVKKYASTAPPTAKGNWNQGRLNCFDQTKEMPCPNPQNFINFDKYHPSTVPGYNMAIDLAHFINEKWKL